MTLAVLATTYNEQENIVNFITAVEGNLTTLSEKSYLVVADGFSTDRTGEIINDLKSKYENLVLLQSPKGGIGLAYREALPYVFNILQVDVVVTMDADLSHQPADITKLVARIREGADLVIGSRYVAGGSIPSEWAWYRKVLSSLGNVIVRLLFGTWQIHEYTTAFRAFSKSLWERLDKTELNFDDNTFLPAFVLAASHCRAQICEVPVTFKDRTAGKSKIEISKYAPRLFKYALEVFVKRML
jgi:dolichol-phosphate mannosyltransferase